MLNPEPSRTETATFAQRLRRGDEMVGTFVDIAEPALAEVLAARMDLLVVDLEHGALTVADLQGVAIAAHGHDCAVLARLPHPNYDGLPAVLDCGVAGVVVPRVDSAEVAAGVADRLRYPPAGGRGYGPRLANAYGALPDYWRTPEAEVACVAQIESRAGLAAVEEIAAVDGLDALLLGPADLSFELGEPLEVGSGAIADGFPRDPGGQPRGRHRLRRRQQRKRRGAAGVGRPEPAQC